MVPLWTLTDFFTTAGASCLSSKGDLGGSVSSTSTGPSASSRIVNPIPLVSAKPATGTPGRFLPASSVTCTQIAPGAVEKGQPMIDSPMGCSCPQVHSSGLEHLTHSGIWKLESARWLKDPASVRYQHPAPGLFCMSLPDTLRLGGRWQGW